MKTKFCKDCKFSVGDDDEFLRCSRTFDKAEYSVTGIKRPKWYCSTERLFPWPFSILAFNCGNSGRFFKPKQTKQEVEG